MLTSSTLIPAYPFEPDPRTGNPCFRAHRNDGTVNYRMLEFLAPHRKDYYFLAFVRQGCSRHWVDMVPYVLQPDTFYFTTPHQVHLKEETQPLQGVSMSFTGAFLDLEEGDFLKNLPLIRNPHNGHELKLGRADLVFVEEIMEKIMGEYLARQGWQQNMLLAYVKVLLIYLSRLYTEQFSASGQAPDKVLLKKYHALIDSSYTRLHEVGDYADLLNISPGHLSEVIKAQSGKPAIAHIHDRLLVEARRLLFHTDWTVKEIAFELGFEDASYFNRFFKRLAQCTPVEYRQQIREMYH